MERSERILPIGLKKISTELPSFEFDSIKLVDSYANWRRDFKKIFYQDKNSPWNEVQNAVISCSSDLLTTEMIEHLLRKKKDTTCGGGGAKFRDNDSLSNGQAALHTFVTPMCIVNLTADYKWAGGHDCIELGSNIARKVVLSAAIQPDLERASFPDRFRYQDGVLLLVFEVTKERVEGKRMSNEEMNKIPTSKELLDDNFRSSYDKKLTSHIIWNLMASHNRPSLEDVKILSKEESCELLLNLVKKETDPQKIRQQLEYLAVKLRGHVLSLECMLNSYVEQIRNEFSVLEVCCEKNGYIYTIDPPAIFLKEVGGARNSVVFNHLQCLAIHILNTTTKFNNLKAIGFNDYVDKTSMRLLKHTFRNQKVEIVQKYALFRGDQGKYSGLENCEGATLVIHNNSDGFGQNIEFEGGFGSLDAVIGQYSDAAIVLARQNPNLMKFVV